MKEVLMNISIVFLFLTCCADNLFTAFIFITITLMFMGTSLLLKGS